MAAEAFRAQLNSMGWSRRVDSPVSTTPQSRLFSTLQSVNPFAAENRGYSRLPTNSSDSPPPQARQDRDRDQEGAWFVLSRWDRILAFAACNLGALVCFIICFALFPALSLRPRKFAVLWSVGSLLFLFSWAFLQGPTAYAKHLLSGPRLPFTGVYLGSIALTLWFAVGIQSTILTLFAAIAQLCALLWYLVSYFPMGSQGLRFASQFGANRAAAWMQG